MFFIPRLSLSKCWRHVVYWLRVAFRAQSSGILADWLKGIPDQLFISFPRRNKSLHAKGGLFRQGKTHIICMGKTPNVMFRVVLLQCFNATLNSVTLRCVDKMDVRGGNHNPLMFWVIWNITNECIIRLHWNGLYCGEWCNERGVQQFFFMVGTILQVLTVCKQYYHKRSISEILKYLSQLYS